MAWKTPKTDWTVTDVLTPKDFNRIEGNTLDNHERLNGHDSNISSINNTLSSHNSRITSNTNRLNGHDSDISSINSTLSNHNNRISSNTNRLDGHLNNKNNPHNVTPEQIGLGSVSNYGLATQAEAQAGTSNAKYMTPLRTKEAIQALQAVKSVAGKTGAVTLSKSDVGLSNVDNVKQVPITRTINGKALSSNITLSASDVGAVPTSRTINGKALSSNITIDVSNIPGLVGTNLALGQGTSAGTSSVAIGHNASAGNYSVALGNGASAAGFFSVALGRYASAGNDNEGILGSAGDLRTSIWKVPGSFSVSGTKKFEIPHPKPEKKTTHVIRHGAVESPTPGDTLYRWKVQATKDNDIVTIDLPDYFVWLNKDVQVFVTPQGHFGNGYGELNRETEQLEIYCQHEGEYNVLVIGTRNDDHPSVQEWSIKGVEREIGESWTGETYAFSVDEILEVEEIKEVS